MQPQPFDLGERTFQSLNGRLPVAEEVLGRVEKCLRNFLTVESLRQLI